MSKSLNRWTGLGNLGRDPEIKSTGGGTLVANFSIACSERFKDSAGEWKDRTEWVSCVAFGRTAEIVRDYVKKGSKLYVEGRIKTDSWDDRQSGAKRYKTYVAVDEVLLLDRAEGGQRPAARSQAPESAEISDEEIPF